LSGRNESKLAFDVDFAVGGVMHQLHHAFRGRKLEREIREMVTGYPSVGQERRVPLSELDLIDAKHIFAHNMCHIGKPSSGPDYKVECAPVLYPKYVPTRQGDLGMLQCPEHTRALCHFVAMDSGGEAVFPAESTTVHVDAHGMVAVSSQEPHFQVVVLGGDGPLPEGLHHIVNALVGEKGETVQLQISEAEVVEFKNPNNSGGGVWFGEVLLLFHFKHLGEDHACAYVQYLQLVEPGTNGLPEQHLPFSCFRLATEADGGAYGVVGVSSIMWLAPIVPDLVRQDSLWRLNTDAWM
jgi:hypothetical protein